MRDYHAFGDSGRSRRIEDVGGMVGLGNIGRCPDVVVAGLLESIEKNTAISHFVERYCRGTLRNTREIVAQLVGPFALQNCGAYLGITKDLAITRDGCTRIQRNICGPGLQRAEDSRDGIDRLAHAKGDPIAGPDSEVMKPLANAIG